MPAHSDEGHVRQLRRPVELPRVLLINARTGVAPVSSDEGHVRQVYGPSGLPRVLLINDGATAHPAAGR